MSPHRRSGGAFVAITSLLFAASAALTAAWRTSMSAMGGMPMSGGWTMSMAWMRLPGRSWPATAIAFVSMWFVMMVAMMLPSLAAVLRRDGQAAVRAGERWPDWQTILAGTGYFLLWTTIGLAAFPIGAALAALEMRHEGLAQGVPLAAGIVVIIAGAVQFTPWKMRHLACWRAGSGLEGTAVSDASAALAYGVRLGVRCLYCCGNLMAILLALGVMDLRVMAALTAAMTVERLAPAGDRIARATGAVAVAAGLLLTGRAAGLG